MWKLPPVVPWTLTFNRTVSLNVCVAGRKKVWTPKLWAGIRLEGQERIGNHSSISSV